MGTSDLEPVGRKYRGPGTCDRPLRGAYTLNPWKLMLNGQTRSRCAENWMRVLEISQEEAVRALPSASAQQGADPGCEQGCCPHSLTPVDVCSLRAWAGLKNAEADFQKAGIKGALPPPASLSLCPMPQFTHV